VESTAGSQLARWQGSTAAASAHIVPVHQGGELQRSSSLIFDAP